jgi:DNA polymerase-1
VETAIYDEQAVVNRYGLKPSQMLDYRALKGDPSDNIPGVRGIGEKGAIELIKEFGSLDNLYKAVRSRKPEGRSKIRPRILQLLEAQEEGARQSYELSTIKCDVPVEIYLPPYEFTPENFEAAFKLFQELEFKSLVSKLPKIYGPTIKPENFVQAGSREEPSRKRLGKQKYSLVESKQQLEEVLAALSGQKELALDTESNSLNPISAKLVGLSLCCADGAAYFIPAELARGSRKLKDLLESNIEKIGHNLKYDYLVLENDGIRPSRLGFDTMIASYLLNPGTHGHRHASGSAFRQAATAV